MARFPTRHATVLAASAAAVISCTVALPAPAHAAASAPTVTSVSPDVANVAGGDRITVRGTNFRHVRHVYFGATAGRSVRVISARTLRVTAPGRKQGDVHVRVVTAASTSRATSANEFHYRATPRVTSVWPRHGLVTGGERLTVRGSGLTWVRRVSFGDRTGRSVRVVSDRLLRVTAPPRHVGGVHVRVVTAHGTSNPVPGAAYEYRPLPLRALAADTTATSVTLSWRPPAHNASSTVMIRRRSGSTPPAWPTSGHLVASITDGSTFYRDLDRTPGTQYAYSAFAVQGAYDSAGVGVPATTTATARPSAPIELALSPTPHRSSAGPCSGASGWLPTVSGSDLRLGARVADPDDPTTLLQGEFELRDLGSDGSGPPVDIVTRDDAAGHTSSFPGPDAYVSVSVSGDDLTDGYAYAVDAYTSNGTAESGESAACTFRYDSGRPSTPHATASKKAIHVGDTVKFTLRSTDPVPDVGRYSGIDHFRSSLDDKYSFKDVAATGTGASGTATVTITPAAWGTHYLYVEAVDRAGNVSHTATYPFYVIDG